MGSRPARINFAHAYQHVTSRGTDQWIIFHDDRDRDKFMHILARVCRRYGVEVVAFCLMGNHFHLVIYVPQANLSDAMRDLKSAYGTYHNERHRRTGPVHGARFYSKVIRDDKQLLNVVRYVHRNALDLDPAISLAEYQWSSHGIYLGLRAAPAWFQPRIAQEMFGASYQQAVEAPRAHDKVQNRPGRIVQAPGAWTIQSTPSLAEIVVAVAHCASCSVDDVRPRAHNGYVGIAALLAVELSSYTTAEIAEPLGFKTAGAVYKQLQRTRKRLPASASAAELYRQAGHLLRHRQAA